MRGVLLGMLLPSSCVFITDADQQARADLLAQAATSHTGAVSGDDDDATTPSGPTTLPGSYLAVDVGLWATCAIDDRRQLVCWGDDVASWWPEVPTDLDAFGISVGLAHGCAWGDTGDTRCFGPAGGSTNNPAPGIVESPTGSFDTVSCAATSCCGLDDGSLSCWGTEEGITPSQGYAPASPPIDVSLWGPGCVLDDNDGIDCFSFNTGGEDPDPPYDTDSDWVEVNDGGWACARRANATVFGCWNTGASSGFIQLLDVPGTVDLIDPVALDNGGQPYVCGLVGGEVACYGVIGFGEAPAPEAPAGNWAQLSMHGDVGCVIDAAGAMSCWGEGSARPR